MLKSHIQTLGCQMNKNDSERIASVVGHLGYSLTDTQEDADLIIVNTCSIRQSAEDRVFGQARNWNRLKKENPELIVAVTGCMPGRDRDGMLREKLPMVDLFFPIKDLPQLPKWISEMKPDIVNSGDLAEDYLKIKPTYSNAKQAFVTINSGCNNYCTFCVVPYSRGFERSKSVKDVLAEINDLNDHEYIEVTLLGQNVNTYRPQDTDSFSKNNPYKDPFAALLWEVNQMPNIKRIHFTSPNPQDMTDEVIDALKLPNHLNILHLPVQSGSERILKKMNRRHTRKQYFEIIEKVIKVRPTIALATDIIVGFCTETDKDFMDTVDLYQKVRFDISYTAMYSSRSGTVAGKAWEDDVPKEEKRRRWDHLQNVMTDIVREKNKAYAGKTVEVLVESHANGIAHGRSRELKLVQFPTLDESVVGTLVPVHIEQTYEWVLHGSQKKT